MSDYPWTKFPLIISAPMAKIAVPKLAVEVSKAGGLGFIGAGYNSDNLEELLVEAEHLLKDSAITQSVRTESSSASPKFLPIGVGFITWSASLETALESFSKYHPAAVWLFAPENGINDLIPWATQIRNVTQGKTKIWVQIGSVSDAVEAIQAIQPDTLVVQGSDAGGHGLAKGASLISLLPEISDKVNEINRASNSIRKISLVAAGGISDSRGVHAALALGGEGCVLGTRFLASSEAAVSPGYQKAILEAKDGGVSTVRTKIYDKVRDVHGWPGNYDGRGLINRTFVDHLDGLSEGENCELYKEELKKGDDGYGSGGRLTTYAGTGVGLVKEILPAGDIVVSLCEGVNAAIRRGNRISHI